MLVVASRRAVIAHFKNKLSIQKGVLIMKAIVTRFDPEKARKLDGGKREAFTLMPEELSSDIVFHWIKLGKDFANKTELDEIQKTIIIFEGAGVFVVDGEDVPVKRGDVLWLSKGSYHSVKTMDSELQYIVVKAQ